MITIRCGKLIPTENDKRITHTNGSYVVKFSAAFMCLFVCLSVFYTISQKRMQLGSPNLTKKCSAMSPGNPFILGSKRSKVKVVRHKNTVGVDHHTLVGAGFF